MKINLKKLTFKQIWFLIGMFFFLVIFTFTVASFQNWIYLLITFVLMFRFIIFNIDISRDSLKQIEINEEQVLPVKKEACLKWN